MAHFWVRFALFLGKIRHSDHYIISVLVQLEVAIDSDSKELVWSFYSSSHDVIDNHGCVFLGAKLKAFLLDQVYLRLYH